MVSAHFLKVSIFVGCMERCGLGGWASYGPHCFRCFVRKAMRSNGPQCNKNLSNMDLIAFIDVYILQLLLFILLRMAYSSVTMLMLTPNGIIFWQNKTVFEPIPDAMTWAQTCNEFVLSYGKYVINVSNISIYGYRGSCVLVHKLYMLQLNLVQQICSKITLNKVFNFCIKTR